MASGYGSDLPPEVVHLLPQDPYAQLELAHRIANYALTSKVAQLEAEAQQLRESLVAKSGTIKTLERRTAGLELEVQEMQSKFKQSTDEARQLASEKAALIDTVKRLNREVAKLEAFKRSLLQHLQDDDEASPLDVSSAAVDMSSERLVSEVLSSASKGGVAAHSHVHTTTTFPARGLTSNTPNVTSTSSRPASAYPTNATSSHPGGGNFSSNFTPAQYERPSPRSHAFAATPHPPPSQASGAAGGSALYSQMQEPGSAKGVGGLGASLRQQQQPGTGAANYDREYEQALSQQQQQRAYEQQQQQQQSYEQQQPMSALSASLTGSLLGGDGFGSTGPSSIGSGGGGSPTKIDGKEFFRQARARLSYEQFSQFLHNIKELNAGRQSREETLRRARDAFGSAHQDMYGMFEGLLTRHISSF